jgi:hypothetical protein
MSNQAKPAATTPTGTTARPSMTTGTGQGHSSGIPHERIANRAYEKWCRRGCPHGTHQQDWLEAEAELRTEVSGTSAPRSSQPTQPAAMPQKSAQRH